MLTGNSAPVTMPVRSPFGSPAGRICVLGLGNILLSDEGAGVHAAEALAARFSFSPAIDIIDGGTMGLDLLPLFQERERMLIIDAVDFRKPSGHVGLIDADGVPSVLNAKLSVHHIGLADLIVAAKLTREAPLQFCLVGIQPESLEIGLSLTPVVSSRLPDLVGMAVAKLAEWGIECMPR